MLQYWFFNYSDVAYDPEKIYQGSDLMHKDREIPVPTVEPMKIGEKTAIAGQLIR